MSVPTIPEGVSANIVLTTDGIVKIHYFGGSIEQIESAGWRHVESTDWFGVAEAEVPQED